MNSNWYVTTGGDGFRSQVDPDDANTVYAESQFGVLVRYDKGTGEQILIQPQEPKGGPPLRWNWDSPLIVSPHSHTRLYFGGNVLFRSDDRGDSWKPVSPDLTRQLDRNKLPVMGKVWGPDAVAKNQSTSFYGNIVSIAESPLKEGQLYVGTDDGLIQVTQDGGATWTKYAKFPGVPEMTYVSRLAGSRHEGRHSLRGFRQSQERRLQAVSSKVHRCGQNLDVDCRRPARERTGAGLCGRSRRIPTCCSQVLSLEPSFPSMADRSGYK